MKYIHYLHSFSYNQALTLKDVFCPQMGGEFPQ